MLATDHIFPFKQFSQTLTIHHFVAEKLEISVLSDRRLKLFNLAHNIARQTWLQFYSSVEGKELTRWCMIFPMRSVSGGLNKKWLFQNFLVDLLLFLMSETCKIDVLRGFVVVSSFLVNDYCISFWVLDIKFMRRFKLWYSCVLQAVLHALLSVQPVAANKTCYMVTVQWTCFFTD